MVKLFFQWLMADYDNNTWGFDVELRKTRKLVMAKGKPEDATFIGEDEDFPDDIETLIFDDMSKGRTLETMEEAQALVAALEQSGVSMPIFPPAVWAVRR